MNEDKWAVHHRRLEFFKRMTLLFQQMAVSALSPEETEYWRAEVEKLERERRDYINSFLPPRPKDQLYQKQ